MLSLAFSIFYYLLSIVALWLGVLSLRGGVRYLQYFRQEIAKPKSDFQPFASIIAPCCGIDEGLRENLRALFEQNYPVYEIVFVVADARDASVATIEILRREFADKISSKIIVAGKAVDSGQKVHNLRHAVQKVSLDSRIFAFVDSDARPVENWLRDLIAPLIDENIGAATGYRWFIGKRRNLATELRAAWNASIASALGANLRGNFCWGGATAIRRETFEQIQMFDEWRGTLSDDFAMMRVLRRHNLPIYFVPQCLTVSIEDCTWRELFEFSTRQMKITRVYAAHFWKASLIGSALFTLVFFGNILLANYLAFAGSSFWLPFGFAFLIFALGAAKAHVRLAALKLALPDYRKELNQSWLAQISLWCLTPPLYFYNCLAAAFSRTIRWRGTEYYLKSPTETVIINQSKN